MKHLQATPIALRLILGLLTLGLMITNFAPAASLATETATTITATVNLEAIEWQIEPENSYERLILVVVGPDETISRLIFEAGDLPYLGLNTLTSADMTDGFYKYELKLVPILTPEARELITLIREEGENSDLANEVRESGLLTTEGVVLAGNFTISEGVFVLPDTSETFQRVDQVVLDDMIVDGSLCVGFDCVNGESFGFDTIRVKENNLRIHFQDTSNSASFPTNDWRIVINDSSNGGASYFAIEDSNSGRQTFKVEAGAPSSSLYVEDSGQIGLGTANPVVELHIADGDTPTVRLEQDGTSGFTPQTWDVAGNETNFFIRDATNGSKLPFRIKPSAPSSSLYIDTNGDIGIGTASPAAKLHVYGTDAEPGNLQIDGNALINGELQLASSREIKTEIHELGVEEAKEAFAQLTPVSFHYKKNLQRRQVGFIAEDVPEMFASRSRRSVNPMDIVAVMTKVLQEQQELIKDQRKALQRLDSKLQTLEDNLTFYNY